MSDYKDESKLGNNRYSLLWVVSFIVMIAYATLFHDNKETSDSSTVLVAVPYMLIATLTFIIQQFKLLGTKR